MREVRDHLTRDILWAVVRWVSKQDPEFAAEVAKIRKSHERCYLYPACRNRGGCTEHPRSK